MEALLFLIALAVVLAGAFAFFGTGGSRPRPTVRRAPRDVIVERQRDVVVERPGDVVVERRPRRRRRQVVVEERDVY